MRKTAFLAAGAVGLFDPGPAIAQSSTIADVIGQTVGNMANVTASLPDACFEKWMPTTDDIDNGKARVDSDLAQYVQLATSGTDVRRAFIGSRHLRRWTIDGQKQDPRALHDPWIGKGARLEQVAFTVGNWKLAYHAQWKAVAPDGAVLGLYDAWMVKADMGSRFVWLDLYSGANTDEAMANTPFCAQPGDEELWKVEKAKRAAKRAQKQSSNSYAHLPVP